MAKVALILLLVSLLLELTSAQISSMCISQFALANQACSVMPPVEEDPDEPSNNHGHGHGRGNGHHPRANQDCCRWLEEVENDCVCQALARLPMFLNRPKHTYMLSVGTTCKFAYKCGGA